jgi:hypothetical protein
LLFLLPLLCALAGCGSELPEADSEAARLYVTYCSGSGCHGAIPPASDGPRYWQMQYTRMIDLMQRQGVRTPDEREAKLIQDYLARNAYQP